MSWLQGLFQSVLRMSVTASWVAAGVIVARFALKKLPKVFSYALWAVLLFRLLCPLTLPSPFSVFRLFPQQVPIGSLIVTGLTGKLAVQPVTTLAEPLSPPVVHTASAGAGQIVTAGLSVVWLAGLLVLVAYAAVSYARVDRHIETATRVAGDVYESDQIGTAFVGGFLRPRILLPAAVANVDRSYMIAHERTHIQRRDHLIKPLAFLVLAVHWFNPLMWLSFFLMSRDMEMSCDEAVMRTLGSEAKGGYSSLLLSLSVRAAGLKAASPLAFGESNVMARVRNILSYRRPAFWAAVAGIVVVAAVATGFAFDANREFDLDDTLKGAMTLSTEATDLLTIGEAAAQHYYSAFMGGNVPMEYRITAYQTKGISLLAGDAREFCVAVTADYSTTGTYFLSANGSFAPSAGGYDCVGDYHEFRVKSLGGSKYQTVSIGTGGGAQGLAPANADAIGPSPGAAGAATGEAVETSLGIIMSSPLTSSNPQDYINTHAEEYDKILKLGDNALSYMLGQFADGKADGLRGQIMMRLCRRLLGVRDNVAANVISPQAWYAALSIPEETRLPSFTYTGADPIEQLVYSTETKMSSGSQTGFVVVAPHVFGSYTEGNKLKVVVTTYSATYRLYANRLELVTAKIVPAAITYDSDGASNRVLSLYERAKEGGLFASSVRSLCTMPTSGKEIKGLADQVMYHYSGYDDIVALQYANLRQHLLANGVKDAVLTDNAGKVLFSLR